ncbi:MAG: hypothetical protein DWQ02_04735 [Bacteroidetes bacterium]|nr:MAG: hypothetical protein DWQ02_04735 [Bacteroidota bacterium]
MNRFLILFLLLITTSMSCNTLDDMSNPDTSEIKGFQLLNDLKGHWVGSNITAFGHFDFFTFDFRPISAAHLHSIYEGGTNQNIITSIFIADFEGKQQIMARNGGWLGNQYRATYFVLDIAEETETSRYYRLVDAVGREKRAYIEFRFENGILKFDAYKDNSGSLDEPVHHMGFEGTNLNPSYAQAATELFDFPQKVSEVSLENKFTDLIDPDSALFLEENKDPFPKNQHGHLSDLKINLVKDNAIQSDKLLLYISTESIVEENGQVNYQHLTSKVIRTIEVQSNEAFYITTYLHPDSYFITCFSDKDNNFYPSPGDVCNVSKVIEIDPETFQEMDIEVDLLLQ